MLKKVVSYTCRI